MKNIFYVIMISLLAYSCGEKDEVKPEETTKVVVDYRDTVVIFKLYTTKPGVQAVSCYYLLSGINHFNYSRDTNILYLPPNDTLTIKLKLKNVPKSGTYKFTTGVSSGAFADKSIVNEPIIFKNSEDTCNISGYKIGNKGYKITTI